MAYLDGYRTGVEDSLQELNAYQTRILDREDNSGELVQVMNVFFRGARKVVGRSLQTANDAMKLLKGV